MKMAQQKQANVETPRTQFVALAAGVAALGGLLFGYDTGVISGALLFIKDDFTLSTLGQEMVVSGVLVGAIIGAVTGGRLSDIIGRRLLLIITGGIFVFGALLAAVAPTVPILIIGRIIVGLGIGFASFTVPLYISEIAPPQSRGWLVSLNQLAITSGIVLSYLVDYALAGGHNWRWMLGLAVVPGLILAIGMFFLPETPDWLIEHNQVPLAKTILQHTRGIQNVDGEINAIRASLKQQKGDWRELGNPRYRMALIVGIGLAIFQQVTGINTVIYYAPTILRSAGIPSASGAILATTGIGIVNVALTIVAIRIIDKVGRRPLLIWGVIGMAASLFLLGLAFAIPGLSSHLGWLAVICLMLYVATFAIGLGPVFWLMISEIYPLRIRGLAMGVATTANWGANLAVALTFLSLTQSLGQAMTFWLYAILSIATLFFVFYLVPETKGRSLEDIEQSWQTQSKSVAHPAAQ